MGDTPKPNKRVIKRWVEALRSGKYKQGKGSLRKDDRFCCLGVLCDLHSRTKHGEKWDYMDKYYGISGTLPEPVIEWAGLTSPDPRVGIKDNNERLSILNDDGKRFTTIANAIERKFLGGAK